MIENIGISMAKYAKPLKRTFKPRIVKIPPYRYNREWGKIKMTPAVERILATRDDEFGPPMSGEEFMKSMRAR
jgi:hypothetical protein